MAKSACDGITFEEINPKNVEVKITNLCIAGMNILFGIMIERGECNGRNSY